MPGVDQSVPSAVISGVESASKVDPSKFEPESKEATKGVDATCIIDAIYDGLVENMPSLKSKYYLN